jgi:hypothetical protein
MAIRRRSRALTRRIADCRRITGRLEHAPDCHPERSEGSGLQFSWRATMTATSVPRFARDDNVPLGMTGGVPTDTSRKSPSLPR